MRFPTVSGKDNTSYLSKVSGNSKGNSQKASKSSSSSKKSSTNTKSSSNSTLLNTNTQPEVGKLSENVIYIKTSNGQYATLNVSKNVSNEQILNWGKKFGVDMSPYLT